MQQSVAHYLGKLRAMQVIQTVNHYFQKEKNQPCIMEACVSYSPGLCRKDGGCELVRATSFIAAKAIFNNGVSRFITVRKLVIVLKCIPFKLKLKQFNF